MRNATTAERDDAATGPVVVVRHESVEKPGRIGRALDRQGIRWRSVSPHAGDPLPTTAENLRALVVLGGCLGLADLPETPFLRAELRLIDDAIGRDVPVLGICLGSQLLAHALGGGVARGPWQLGWGPVSLTTDGVRDPVLGKLPAVLAPETPEDGAATNSNVFPALHWHHDWLVPPSDAKILATDADGPACQVFRFGRSLGMLCHLEAEASQVIAMAKAFPTDLAAAGIDARTVVEAAESLDSAASRIGNAVFDAWAIQLPRT